MSTKTVNNMIDMVGNDENDKEQGAISLLHLKKVVDEVFNQKHDIEIVNNRQG